MHPDDWIEFIRAYPQFAHENPDSPDPAGRVWPHFEAWRQVHRAQVQREAEQELARLRHEMALIENEIQLTKGVKLV